MDEWMDFAKVQYIIFILFFKQWGVFYIINYGAVFDSAVNYSVAPSQFLTCGNQSERLKGQTERHVMTSVQEGLNQASLTHTTALQ